MLVNGRSPLCLVVFECLQALASIGEPLLVLSEPRGMFPRCALRLCLTLARGVQSLLTLRERPLQLAQPSLCSARIGAEARQFTREPLLLLAERLVFVGQSVEIAHGLCVLLHEQVQALGGHGAALCQLLLRALLLPYAPL